MAEIKINTDDFPNNSIINDSPSTSRDNRPKVKKIVNTGKVIRKKNSGKNILRAFLSDDINNIKEYIFMDVVIPALKDMIVDAGRSGLERLFYGTRQNERRVNRPSYISYNRQYNDPREYNRINLNRTRHNFDDIILENRSEAEEVLHQLNDIIDRYDEATISDLYNLVGITGTYMDDKWGWTNLHGVSVRRVNNGYLLDLPRPKSLN